MPLVVLPPASIYAMPELGLVAAYWRHYALSTSTVRSERLAAADYQWAWDAVEEELSGPSHECG